MELGVRRHVGVGYELVSAPFLDLPNLAFRRARSVGEQTKIEKKAARQAIFSRGAEKPDAAQPLHHRTTEDAALSVFFDQTVSAFFSPSARLAHAFAGVVLSDSPQGATPS
ncbi:hypothetical protein L1887_58112 [Cichorium endivia]|nr:hypothetical protein L1887_58112 [Cichorium endivia]